ncbi:exodeoxyribonuclease V subunit alpha [Colwellia asteriadis]|uniref:RecBCD enzyme subunit RecD n=1 Tax=Colwellia asteriadis TaxID=517723 RepID=A0ABP3WMV2_9GAMM
MNNVYSSFAQAKQKIHGLEAIDYFFAKEMVQALVSNDSIHRKGQVDTGDNHSDNDRLITHILLALSESLRAGHTCLPLSELANKHWGCAFDNYGEVSHSGVIFPELTILTTTITALALSPEQQQPIVFHHGNLYLRRYFQFECELAQDISMRIATRSTFSLDEITECISGLFPEDNLSETRNDVNDIDWQKVAVANAINKNFSVIAGGPGTGKTYTVTKLLAALVMLQQSDTLSSSELSIALVAPTGKAAQRLSESIVKAVAGFSELIASDVLAKIPSSAQTIHRLLGVIPNSPNFRHGIDNKLAYDVVLIDEVSMVDLPLMTRVFRALKPNTKVILLGDADQLPSVATGSVLADIAPRPHGGFSTLNCDYLAQVCQLKGAVLRQAFSPFNTEHSTNPNDYLTYLLKSRRFDGKGGIGLLASAVIKGDSQESWGLLTEAKAKNSSQLALATTELSAWLAPLIKQYFQPIEHCENVSEAFKLLAQFRVLCATRQGSYGVEAINDYIKRYLGKAFVSQHSEQQGLYHGQPIMISENNYRLGLYNGDIGIIWRVDDENNSNSHLMACFESSDQAQPIRRILPSRLPKYETVYAMTIHKTQGSEFTHVAMLLSETGASHGSDKARESKLLSRELLYTAITRAKQQITVASNQSTWQQGVNAQVKRHSGLSLSCSDFD